MDEAGLACFKARIGGAKTYLEYGCGGSTVFAASVARVPAIISIDSDKKWADAVRQELAPMSPKLLLEHCDIGEVREWGNPVDERGIKNYWRYPTMPWTMAKTHSLVPDLVLIDGRFRVACFLYSLLCARVGTIILFDDYFDRPNYFVVEQYCALTERAGRMGVFTVTKEFSTAELCARFAEFSVQVG